MALRIELASQVGSVCLECVRPSSPQVTWVNGTNSLAGSRPHQDHQARRSRSD